MQQLALYINKDVDFKFPNTSIKNEVDLIAHAEGSIVIDDPNELPKWERTIITSDNYTEMYEDVFTFFVHGIENETPQVITDLRTSRVGFVAEVITKGSKSFVFPSPVFVSKKNVKKVNSHSWEVELTYRVPTARNYYKKLNTLLMTNSYIALGNNVILGAKGNLAIVSN